MDIIDHKNGGGEIDINNILSATLFGLLSGILGTTLGGLGVIFIRQIHDFLLSIVLGISAGIMTVIVFLDLIPEAYINGSFLSGLIGIFLGIVLIALLDISYPHCHFSMSSEHFEKNIDENNRYIKIGFLLILGIALHNIPEGLAIGSGYISSDTLGLKLAVLMTVQNFPEGMAVAAALCLAGLKASTVIWVTGLSGLPMGIGALIGAYLGGISQTALSISLGFAAGAMLYIVFDELIPDAHERASGHSAIIGILSGVFIGLILTELLH